MRHPLIVVYEGDNKVATQLRALAEQERWLLREQKQVDACLRQLEGAGPTVLIIRTGRDLVREMTLLQQAALRSPQTSIVLVGDLEHPSLAGLAWDLGADYVLFPPQPRELLPEIVKGLMG